MRKTVASELYSLLVAIENCQKHGNIEWEQRHKETLTSIMYNYLPHGSGIDGSTSIDKGNNCFVIGQAYHHMDENGMYDGWTDFRVIVRPAFDGVDLRIVGRFPRKYADTREYLAEIYGEDLETEYVREESEVA